MLESQLRILLVVYIRCKVVGRSRGGSLAWRDGTKGDVQLGIGQNERGWTLKSVLCCWILRAGDQGLRGRILTGGWGLRGRILAGG
jgi:hypothetical protein